MKIYRLNKENTGYYTHSRAGAGSAPICIWTKTSDVLKQSYLLIMRKGHPL